MTVATKRRLLVIWLVLFSLWPLGHHALVTHYRMNPWKLFGWAMYCVPNLPVRVELTTLEGAPLAHRDGMEERIDAFIERRRILGELAPPDALAASVLESDPSLDGVEIAIERLELDPRTDTIVSDVRRYRFER